MQSSHQKKSQIKDAFQGSRVKSARRSSRYFNRVKICEKLSLELGLEIFSDFSKNPQML